MIGSAKLRKAAEEAIKIKDLYNPDYEVKRSDKFTGLVVYPSLSLAANIMYNVHFNNLDNLSPLRDNGFILLPKHQSLVDIVVEGMTLKKAVNRYANYLMTVRVPYILENHSTLDKLPSYIKGPIKRFLRQYLPKMIELAGGIGIIRKKDLNHRLETPNAQERKIGVYLEELTNLLIRDEIVVVHPEGQVNYKKNTDAGLCKLTVGGLLLVQRLIRKDVPFVSLDIVYEDVHKFRSAIEVTVGKPIIVPSTDKGLEELTTYLRDNITLMH